MKKESVTQLEEKFVSFEIAKLAKEKGFNEFCRKCFNEKGESKGFSGYDYMKEYNKNSTVRFIDSNSKEFGYPSIVCTQPTQSLLNHWLRVNHKIHVSVDREDDYWKPVLIDFKSGNKYKTLSDMSESYEFILEVGLWTALKSLKP